MRWGLFTVEQVVHPDGGAAEVGGVGHAEADQVVEGIVGMGVRAHGHAAPAVGADGSPIGIAALRIDLPA